MKDYVNSAALQEYTTKLVAKLKTLFPGTPTAAATVADMTDHSKTYVYVGSETGYTAGDWYYWNGTAWTSGGPFQATSIITDTTLAVAGEAADAKATGDAIAAAKTAVLNAMAPAYSPSETYAVGAYVNQNGEIYRCTTAITTAEAWTAGHWAEVPLGTDLADQVSDLKTHIDTNSDIKTINLTRGAYLYTGYNVGATCAMNVVQNASYAYAVENVDPHQIITVNGTGAGNAVLWTFIDENNIVLARATDNAHGDNLLIYAPENAAKVIINTTVSDMGLCCFEKTTAERENNTESILTQYYRQTLLQQNNLKFENSNFVVQNGEVYAISGSSPYNCMVIDAHRIDLDYRKRSSVGAIYVGVAVDGNFVGCSLNVQTPQIKIIYGTTNTAYEDAELLSYTAYSDTNYQALTVTLENNVLEVKKGADTLLKFSVNRSITVDGMAILNANLSRPSKGKPDIIDLMIIKDDFAQIARQAADADIIGIPSNHRLIAGVIRNSGSGWEFIVNDKHQGDMNCINVGIDANDGRLFIDYSGIGAKKVISLLCAPDEAFAAAGYVMGASVGLEKAYLQIFQYGLESVSAKITFSTVEGSVTPSASQADGVTGAEWNDDNKSLVVRHATMHNKVSGTIAPFVSIIPAVYGKYITRLASFSVDSTRIEYIDPSTKNKVETPDAGMSINFARLGTALKRNEIDPSTIASSAGNIWFMGIFEV